MGASAALSCAAARAIAGDLVSASRPGRGRGLGVRKVDPACDSARVLAGASGNEQPGAYPSGTGLR